MRHTLDAYDDDELCPHGVSVDDYCEICDDPDDFMESDDWDFNPADDDDDDFFDDGESEFDSMRDDIADFIGDDPYLDVGEEIEFTASLYED